MHAGESGFYLHAVQVFQRLKKSLHFCKNASWRSITWKSDANNVSCALVCGLAAGTSYHLTRGCLETETKKHSCHSFTLFLLGFDQRETLKSVPIDMFTQMFDSFLQIHISTWRFFFNVCTFVFFYFLFFNPLFHPPPPICQERATFDRCRHGSTGMQYRKCKCKLQHFVEYSEMTGSAADLLKFLNSC